MKKLLMLGAIAAIGLSTSPAHAVGGPSLTPVNPTTPTPTPASLGKVGVYDAITSTSSQYVNFLNDENYTTGYLTSGFTAADIAGLKMVILSGLGSVSATQVLALNGYVNGGGRLFVLSEGYSPAVPSTTTNLAVIGTFNTISVGVGSTILDDTSGQDPAPFRSTTAITAGDPFTAGVGDVTYQFTSGLSGGTTIVKGVSGQNLISYQSIGQGLFVGSSDSTFGFVLGDGHGNDRLMLNLLSVAIPAAATPVPEPAGWATMIVGIGAVGAAMRRRRVGVSVRYA